MCSLAPPPSAGIHTVAAVLMHTKKVEQQRQPIQLQAEAGAECAAGSAYRYHKADAVNIACGCFIAFVCGQQLMEIKGVTDKKVDQLVAAASKISEFTFIVSGAYAHCCSLSAATATTRGS